MSNPIVHPEAKYKVNQVGPTSDWSFKGDNGEVAMKKFSVQFEGIVDWIDVNQKADAAPIAVGMELEGHVEDTGKYGLKFQKKRGAGGGWSGGGKSSPGAQWSAAFDTAATVVGAYFTVSGKKPKNIADFIAKIDEVAPKIKELVDGHAGTAAKESTTEDNKTTSESGESPAQAGVVVDDVADDELGDW